MKKTRNIFEDVNTEKSIDTSIKGGIIDQGRDEWRQRERRATFAARLCGSKT